jgi:hydrogenase-4 membrane subunit HyfE
MKKLLKYGALAGSAMALMPLAARAAEDDMMTDYTATTADTAAATAAAGGFVATAFIIWGIMVVVGIALFVFWILMLIDVFKRTNWKQESDKTLWIILVIILGYLGAIIYYFAVKRQLDAKKK